MLILSGHSVARAPVFAFQLIEQACRALGVPRFGLQLLQSFKDSLSLFFT
jgi:hypothetical protein